MGEGRLLRQILGTRQDQLAKPGTGGQLLRHPQKGLQQPLHILRQIPALPVIEGQAVVLRAEAEPPARLRRRGAGETEQNIPAEAQSLRQSGLLGLRVLQAGPAPGGGIAQIVRRRGGLVKAQIEGMGEALRLPDPEQAFVLAGEFAENIGKGGGKQLRVTPPGEGYPGQRPAELVVWQVYRRAGIGLQTGILGSPPGELLFCHAAASFMQPRPRARRFVCL